MFLDVRLTEKPNLENPRERLEAAIKDFNERKDKEKREIEELLRKHGGLWSNDDKKE